MLLKDKSITLESEDGQSEKSEGSDKNKTRLLAMLFLTFTYFLVEIIVGYMTNSMALVADSFHMLSDVIALIIAYISIKMSPKSWSKNTFGWARAEVLGALVNAVFLVALCFSIIVESIERFIDRVEIKDPKLILIVGGVGLVINLLGLLLFHGHSHGGGGHSHGHSHSHSHSNQHVHKHANLPGNHESKPNNSNHQIHLVGWTLNGDGLNGLKPATEQHEHQENGIINNDAASTEGVKKSSNTKNTSNASQMNMHGVFLHVLADALGSVIVIISALIIWLTDWKYKSYVDPTLSVIMVILILCSVWPLLIQSALVLLQTMPTHIQIDDLRKRLLAKVPGAMEVHEFHIWQLAGNRIIASAHILCNNQTDYMGIGEKVKEFFHNEGIHSTTIQLEFDRPTVDNCNDDQERINNTSDCFLTCPSDQDVDCISNSCCGVKKRNNSSVRDNLAFISENSPPPYSVCRNVT